jgi:hypothetical protein
MFKEDQGMPRSIIKACCWSLMFGVLLIGSCSNSSPVVPGDDNLTDLESRDPFWIAFADLALVTGTDDDKGVDVTNVVCGHDWFDDNDSEDPEDWENGEAGYILTFANYYPEGVTPGTADEIEVNVIAWAQENEELVGPPEEQTSHTYYEVFFKVYGVDTTPSFINSAPFQIPSEYFDYHPQEGDPFQVHRSHGRPKVTAFMQYDEHETPALCVAITYQRNEVYEDHVDRRVYWALYTQTQVNNYDAWTAIVSPEEVAPNYEDYAGHPDIVYGAYVHWDDDYWMPNLGALNPDFEAIILVYEEVIAANSQRTIYYSILHEDNGNGWDVSWDHNIAIETMEVGAYVKVPFYPRVDVGVDGVWAGGDNYYVGVLTYTEVTPVEDEYNVTHYVCNVAWGGRAFNAGDPPGSQWCGGTYLEPYLDPAEDEWEYKNVLPYVDIDPLENYLGVGNNVNYTHCVWSRFINDEDGNEIRPFYTNSYAVYNDTDYNVIYEINNESGPCREGLPTIAAYTDQSSDIASIQFIQQDSTATTTYPVVGSILDQYNSGDPEDPDFDWDTTISVGYSDDDSPWNLGPSNAIRGDENDVLCAWTGFSTGTAPNIWADINDN